MNVTQEDLGNCQVQLTIEVEDAKVADARKQVIRELGKRVQVPGFRRGKAPAHLVERQLLPDVIREETYQEVIPSAVDQAIEEQGIEPYSYQDIELDVLGQEPLVIQAVIPTRPQVILGDISLIEVEEAETEFDPEKVDRILNDLRLERGIQVPVEGAAEEDDEVTFLVDAVLEDGTLIFEGVQNMTQIAPNEYDEEMPLEDRAELIVDDEFVRVLRGMQPGDTREVTVLYPDEYFDESLAGQNVRHTVTVSEIKRRQLPELDDDFAREVTGDLDSLEALRERIATNLRSQAEEDALQETMDRILDALIDESQILYPQAMIKREINTEIARLAATLAKYNITLERYFEITGSTREEVEESLRDEVEARMRSSLVLLQYAEDNGLEPPTEDITREILMAVGSLPENEQQGVMDEIIRGGARLLSIMQGLIFRMALHKLYHEVTGNDEPSLFPDWLYEAAASVGVGAPTGIEAAADEEWANEGGNPPYLDLTPSASGPTQEELESSTLVDESETPADAEWANEGGNPPYQDLTPSASGPTQEELESSTLVDESETPADAEWASEGGNPPYQDLTPTASGPTQEELESDAAVTQADSLERADLG